MTSVPGSSRYYASATLANQRGSVVSAPNVLGNGTSATGLLEGGRQNTGIGLSGSSRAINSQLISQSAAGFNQIFSLNGVEFGNNETLVQKIMAIRASLPESSLAESVRGEEFDTEA